MSSRVVAICNQKGGVGKTTTTFHLARAAVLAGRKVLVIDADAQGNLTSVLAPDVVEGDAGLADALTARPDSHLEMSEVIVASVWDGVDVVPTAGETLSVVREELSSMAVARDKRLRSVLAPVRNNYDLILIDCPPALDQVTVNALSAADQFLIVSHARLWSANGLARLLDNTALIREHNNPDLVATGLVLNQVEQRTRTAQHYSAEIETAAKELGIDLIAVIPKRTVIGDAAEASAGLDEYGTETAEIREMYDTILATIEGN